MTSQARLRQRWKIGEWQSVEKSLDEFVDAGHGRSADELFARLQHLPYRDEVSNGRDLRGVCFAMLRDLDLHGTDFSYSCFHYLCGGNLTQCNFDRSECVQGAISGKLSYSSFRNAKLKNVLLKESEAVQCVFDGANMSYAMIEGVDLRCSQFLNADLFRATLVRVDLRGCIFHGAKLQEVGFHDVLVDATTDFRGADMRNIVTKAQYDNYNQLVLGGSDLSEALHDGG